MNAGNHLAHLAPINGYDCRNSLDRKHGQWAHSDRVEACVDGHTNSMFSKLAGEPDSGLRIDRRPADAQNDVGPRREERVHSRPHEHRLGKAPMACRNACRRQCLGKVARRLDNERSVSQARPT